MNGADPLSQLRDIHLPEPVCWWPPAPGWWFVTALGLAILVASVVWIKNRWQRNRYRRVASRALKNLQYDSYGDLQTCLEKVSILLRQVAMETYGRTAIASLTGAKWLAFLDATGNTDQFSNGPAKVLGYGLYQSTADADMAQVHLVVQKWVKEHTR